MNLYFENKCKLEITFGFANFKNKVFKSEFCIASGLMAVTFGTPADFIRARIMNQSTSNHHFIKVYLTVQLNELKMKAFDHSTKRLNPTGYEWDPGRLL